MKTAQDVLRAIDERLAIMEAQAATPCINALMGDVDREEYREALRLGSALRAIQSLRRELAAECEPDPIPNHARSRSRRRAGSAA